MDQHVTIIGNVTRDLELRYTNSGLAVTDLGVAVNRRVRNAAGEWEDGDATFVDVSVFGEMAEHAADSLTKGTRVVVDGELRLDSWEDKETGAKRTKLKMVANEIGVSLRWANAVPVKVPRDGGKAMTADDAFAAFTPAAEEPF